MVNANMIKMQLLNQRKTEVSQRGNIYRHCGDWNCDMTHMCCLY